MITEDEYYKNIEYAAIVAGQEIVHAMRFTRLSKRELEDYRGNYHVSLKIHTNAVLFEFIKIEKCLLNWIERRNKYGTAKECVEFVAKYFAVANSFRCECADEKFGFPFYIQPTHEKITAIAFKAWEQVQDNRGDYNYFLTLLA